MRGRRSYRATAEQSARKINLQRPSSTYIHQPKFYCGFVAGAIGLTWCYKSAVDNYCNYVRLRTRSESTLQTIPEPRQGGDPFTLQTFNDLKMKRDSAAAELKKYKWTAKLVQMFPPKDF